ncbi:protein kinase domain-containing protein [Hyalangium minutum]|uniref:Adenylate cyclase n=1 Tax=Hyalangium minutum TaxID=394096 RepID=A0A085WPS1_9BACT|nr:protein kinase [Hyalangium minutum]KFE69684.1 Adenylate cyclase [Hyalangium minutum]
MRPDEEHSDEQAHGEEAVWDEADDADLDDSLLAQVAQVSVPLRVPFRGEHLGGQDGQRFEILDQLGGGAMGLVFRARDKELQRVVALKFLLPREGLGELPMSSLLRQEARAVAQLDHENIVRIFDVSEWSGASWEPRIPFLVMECLEGECLSALLLQEHPSLPRTLEIMAAVAAGLGHAHEHHIVHRDLKPGNVFITQKGQVKILDFGLAWLTAAVFPAAPNFPAAGTPSYMAPEQWRGEAQDERTDIWAAGVMLYELLAGVPPYIETSLAELRARVLSDAPVPRLSERRPGLPEELEKLVASMLAKTPRERLSSAAELRERLRRIEEGLTPWRDEPRSLAPQRRQVTLVSCWLADLAGLAEHLDAEDFGELEGAFHQSFSEIIQQHEGSITTCMGDEALACFGYPQAREEDPEKAARAGLFLATHLGTAIQQKLPYLPRRKLTVKVGVHTDTVVLDNLPVELRGRTPALQGEAPKIALWLAHEAAPDTVCLSHTTWKLVRGGFRTEPLGPRFFQGLAGMAKLDVHRLLREQRTTSRFERTHAQGPLTPLVGREPELHQLLESWERACMGQGAFVLVRGEAGIGKSRLIQELRERVPQDSVIRLRCQCWVQFRTSAFAPIIELLQHLLRLESEGSPQANLRKVEGRMRAAGLPPEHVFLVASLLSLPVAEAPPHLRLSPELLKEKTLEALATLLQRMTEERPVFAIVEDLHWADPSTLELLGYLLARIEKWRLCVFLTARRGFEPTWPGKEKIQVLTLERLSPALTAELVRQSASGKALSEETIEQLAAKTDGVPLFVEEMTHMVLEKGSTGSTSAEPFSIPLTLGGLLLARLDKLPRRQKALAQLCAVVGRGFSHALLATLSGRNEAALGQDLSGLLQAGLLQSVEEGPESRYQFRHALIQDAAYQSLLRRTRREYHRRIAQVMAAQFPELADSQPEMLAHHYTEAGEVEPAIHFWAKAGLRASVRSANVEAISHLNQALRLLRSLPEASRRPEQELELQVALGLPLMQTRSIRSREVEQTYSRAFELFHQVGDGLTRVQASTWGSFAYSFMRARFQLGQELAELLASLGERQQSREMLSLGHRMMATNFFTWGQMTTALEHVELALKYSDFGLEQHRELAVKQWVNPRVAALAYGSVVQSALGNMEQARRWSSEALVLAEEIGHHHTLALALTYTALACQLRGELECARERAERCIALSTEHRFRLWLGWSVFIKSWVLSEQGSPREGLALLRANLARWRNAGVKVGMPLFLGMLAEYHMKLGEYSQGLAAVTQALGWADALGERSYESELYRIEGELLQALGYGSAAATAFLHGMEVAERQGAHGFRRHVEAALERQLQGGAGELPLFAPP